MSHSSSPIGSALVFLGMALLPMEGRTEEPELSLDELMSLKVESGSFLHLDLSKSPFSMTIIDRRQIEVSGARDLSELLEIYVPGFQYMINKFTGVNWGLRGLADDRNNKIILMVNGHKLNQQSRDGAMGEAMLGLLRDVERVEVLRGPAGLVYGSGAMAGIVNLVTQQAGAEGPGKVQVGFGSHNDREADLRLGFRPADDQVLALTMGWRRSDGLEAHQSRIYGLPSFPYPSYLPIGQPNGIPSDGRAGYTPGNYRLSADWEWKNLRLYARETHQDWSTGGFFPVNPWPEFEGRRPDSTWPARTVDGRSVTYRDPVWGNLSNSSRYRTHFIVENLSLELNYKHGLGEDEITLRGGYDNSDNRVEQETRPGYERDYHASRRPFRMQAFGERRYTLGGLYLMRRFPRHQLAGGFESRLDDIGEGRGGRNSHDENPWLPMVKEVIYLNQAVFGEGLYEATSRLDLHYGIRYDLHTRTRNVGGVLSPKLAAIYTPVPGHSIKAIFQSSANNGSASSYEHNNFHYTGAAPGEVYTGPHFLNGGFIRPNPAFPIVPAPPSEAELHRLKPERIFSGELASTHQLQERWFLSPSASYTYVKDPFGWDNRLFQNVNVGQYNFINVELEARYTSPIVTAGASHAFQRPVNTDPDQQSRLFRADAYDYGGVWYDSVAIGPGRWRYIPVPSGRDTAIEVNLVKNLVTQDGKDFLNLATHVTKAYLDYAPAPWISFHSDARVFWGLAGREDLYSKEAASGFNHLGMVSDAMVKWNGSIHFRFPSGLEVSGYVHDILGVDRGPESPNSLAGHAARWQYYEGTLSDIYTPDQRSYAVKVEKSF